MEALLARLPVTTMILPEDADDQDERLLSILSAAEENGTDVLFLSEPGMVTDGDLSLSLYLPQAGSDENERGVVVLAEYPGASALIMGDGGMETELALAGQGMIGDADILVVGHHGSKTASGALFLRLVRAETAVVSVGYNPYGLPSAETLDRLEQYCGEVLRTDEMGTVTIDLKENG